jgi:hypothetical protein
MSRRLITATARFRMGVHSLGIDTGRRGRGRVPRAQRVCIGCNLQDREDEVHFAFLCPNYSRFRIELPEPLRGPALPLEHADFDDAVKACMNAGFEDPTAWSKWAQFCFLASVQRDLSD